ncbi:uncharacterized protein BDZ99DRAFT_565291 [Mytilinidion resinicola]|uniref:Uncharacterized protein n=1 Tax=Mytilinidion resinicola TaxID=574789 RepID=A0A6A6ZB79_9PEZI|nr:uncharacterized protein BDZ99DRAFT_565291 [Mytilinidion resinicola]KAF2817565.1 hypothetical protein BDZ99DRAFT_565291 [Mytilinidion resinicola]
MSDSNATIEDPTLYQAEGTPLAANSTGSDEVVDIAGWDTPEHENNGGGIEADAEERARKLSPCADKMNMSSPYSQLGTIERLGALANQLSCRLSRLEGKVDSLEKANRYIMAQLGKFDDRANNLEENWGDTRDIIGLLQTEIDSVKKGINEVSDRGDERVGKAGKKNTASARKRVRGA